MNSFNYTIKKVELHNLLLLKVLPVSGLPTLLLKYEETIFREENVMILYVIVNSGYH